jgi:hypothetical protein
MDKLYPIIRRKRRPLVADAPPIPIQTKPVQPVVKGPEVEPAKITTPDDAKIPTTSELE